jgi:hypothetical protein
MYACALSLGLFCRMQFIKCTFASLGLQCNGQRQKEAGDIDGFLPFPVAAKEVVNKK